MTKIEKMENFFSQWYPTLNPSQKLEVDHFLLNYPIHLIEEDIFSAAEKNNIEIEVPPATLFRIEEEDKEVNLECKFIPLTENEIYIFRNELFNLFEKTKSEYPDKNITFYCMLPFVKSCMFPYRIGIFGTFRFH